MKPADELPGELSGELSEAVRDLDAKARHHKREAQKHRALAREARTRQARLEDECQRLGIAFTTHHSPLTGRAAAHGEGDIHGRHHDPRSRTLDPR